MFAYQIGQYVSNVKHYSVHCIHEALDEHRYPYLQNLQNFAFSGGVSFNILAIAICLAGIVFISV